MGRNPLGDEGRTAKATLRITKQEEGALSRAFVTPGRGLRVLLDQWLDKQEQREALTQQLAEQLDVPREVLGEGSTALDEVNLTAALALDQVKQALPLRTGEEVVEIHHVDHHDSYEVPPPDYADTLTDPPGTTPSDVDLAYIGEQPLPGTIAAGLAPPPTAVVLGVDPVAAPHRHRKGQVISTYWDQGVKKHTHACATEGCEVIL